ncbi:hypothetical protein M407DRAFT_23433 [Tulasnella calospora MUT 4182]|uniref:Protein kinase domain-containing protein n=1 Tax=Tulasnella calospora MUT 4182 TaxID=1051891 RepID=A0A0C3M152_9AGAM|nr:hypothetical protein M407DRAFT_23433 [Tulasnella calospora MUT 4182]
MEKEENYAAKPSQVSGSGEGDPPCASMPAAGSRLRHKLEKLARWQIDPSLIEFPKDAREFRGGYAIVSQAVLASPSNVEGVTHESERVTDESPGSDDRNPYSHSDTQEPKDDQQGKDEGAESGTADSDNDHSKEEGRKGDNNPEEQGSHRQASIPEIGDEPSSSEDIADQNPDSGDCDRQLRSDNQEPEGDQQGQDQGPDGRTADAENNNTGEGTRKEPGGTNEEQNSDRQTPKLKTVAVKKLKIERDTDLERVLGLALRESEFVLDLSHPHIVKLEGFVADLSERKVWLIFPWEEHGNLRDFLASGEWEIPERISLINDVTLGLEYIHQQEPPIYHGDLKSLNILVNSGCSALITDFGSARHLGKDHIHKEAKKSEDNPEPATHPITGDDQVTLQALFSATATTLTLAGSSYTIRWAAPELLQDENPCLRSDIWALGWIAYEVMTNTIPFHDVKKDAIVINRVVQGHLPSVTEDARMSLIRALCYMMVQCWNINPDKRPTAEECRKSISWMPRIVPAPTQTIDEEASRLRHAQLLNQLGYMYRLQADYPSALRCFTEALDIYTTNNDNSGRALMLRNIADVHRYRHQHTEAITFYSEALEIYPDVGDESEKASARFGLADAYRTRGDYGEAVKLYSDYLDMLSGTGSSHARALALWGLADVHRIRHEHSDAINLYSEALSIFTDVGDQGVRAITLWGLAEVHRAEQEYDEATRLYSEAEGVLTDIGDKHWLPEALWGLAQTHQMQDHHNEAITFYTKASEVLAEIGESSRAADALENAANIRRRMEGASEDPAGTGDAEEESLLKSE